MIWIIFQTWIHAAVYYLLFKIYHAEYEIHNEWLFSIFSHDNIWQNEKLQISLIDNAEQLICHVVFNKILQITSDWVIKIENFQQNMFIWFSE